MTTRAKRGATHPYNTAVDMDDQADGGGENGRHKQADQPVVWGTAPNRPGRSGSNRGRPKMNLFVELFERSAGAGRCCSCGRKGTGTWLRMPLYLRHEH
ncbi:unnamed protein product [Ectocarpus sp. 12 AP-2014]